MKVGRRDGSSAPVGDARPREERVDALVQRVTADASRAIDRFVGDLREELEDLVAEARDLNERPSDG